MLERRVINVGVIGLGKMGLSHLAIANALPEFRVIAVCDSMPLVGNALSKATGLNHYSSIDETLNLADLQAVIIATPTASHAEIIRKAIGKNLHVFCEKPLTLHSSDSHELSQQAAQKNLITQVGYHNRFVAAFGELRQLIRSGAVGRVTQVLAEAYGPVVTRPAKMSWRGNSREGGGALFDYAAHPLNLLNWFFGEPQSCGDASLRSIYSRQVDDQVTAQLRYKGMDTQLSVNWSDSSQRKMTTQITVWGEHGRLYADRQEVRAFLTEEANIPPGYKTGWTVRYTTELTEPVKYYLRGEEYSAQLEHFARRIEDPSTDAVNTFAESAETDETIRMIREAALGASVSSPKVSSRREASFLSKLFQSS